MPKIAGDPLTKVTLNLYEADVYWYQEEYGQGWSTRLRDDTHRYIQLTKEVRAREATYEQRNRPLDDA